MVGQSRAKSYDEDAANVRKAKRRRRPRTKESGQKALEGQTEPTDRISTSPLDGTTPRDLPTSMIAKAESQKTSAVKWAKDAPEWNKWTPTKSREFRLFHRPANDIPVHSRALRSRNWRDSRQHQMDPQAVPYLPPSSSELPYLAEQHEPSPGLSTTCPSSRSRSDSVLTHTLSVIDNGRSWHLPDVGAIIPAPYYSIYTIPEHLFASPGLAALFHSPLEFFTPNLSTTALPDWPLQATQCDCDFDLCDGFCVNVPW